MAPMLQDFVAKKIGQRFIEPQTTNLAVAFADSSPTVPMIFVLSQGTDPAADLYKFAEEMNFTKKLASISLGQGQVCCVYACVCMCVCVFCRFLE